MQVADHYKKNKIISVRWLQGLTFGVFFPFVFYNSGNFCVSVIAATKLFWADMLECLFKNLSAVLCFDMLSKLITVVL